MEKNKQLNTEINHNLKITTDIPFRYQNTIYQMDDEKLIITHHKNWMYRGILIAYHSVFLYVSWFGFVYAEPLLSILGFARFIFWLGVFITAIVFLINDFISKDNTFVFNRIENTLTMNAKIINWKNKKITFPFKHARFSFIGYPGTMLIVLFPHSFWFLSIISTGNDDDQESCLSFLTWYMDKNRPLPPDPRLDPYREKDYQRRKAEGFPPPLYPSTIPTPDTYIPIKW